MNEVTQSNTSNTEKARVSNVTVSAMQRSTFVFVHRGSNYCRVYEELTHTSLARVQRAQVEMAQRRER